ncbi:hypothetical protein RJ639_000291 [Escallonia herrerae]|uniref:Uncharacterized protein n=1 Tax=Escallonia herrerae TaxID=1293975 RepID=A0AA89BGS6_9ASTE|nr:hypothetical protein RJ639_000291 [Escallonia herrerae]
MEAGEQDLEDLEVCFRDDFGSEMRGMEGEEGPDDFDSVGNHVVLLGKVEQAVNHCRDLAGIHVCNHIVLLGKFASSILELKYDLFLQADRFAFLDNYTRFAVREEHLPPWSPVDVEIFITVDPVYGPTRYGSPYRMPLVGQNQSMVFPSRNETNKSFIKWDEFSGEDLGNKLVISFLPAFDFEWALREDSRDVLRSGLSVTKCFDSLVNNWVRVASELDGCFKGEGSGEMEAGRVQNSFTVMTLVAVFLNCRKELQLEVVSSVEPKYK